MTKKTKPNVTRFPPRPGQLMETIRKLAKERKVYIGTHARQRQKERSDFSPITDAEIYQVLELGSIEGIPRKGKNHGEWNVTVTFRQKGAREIGIATIVIDEDHDLFVITAMWRD